MSAEQDRQVEHEYTTGPQRRMIPSSERRATQEYVIGPQGQKIAFLTDEELEQLTEQYPVGQIINPGTQTLLEGTNFDPGLCHPITLVDVVVEGDNVFTVTHDGLSRTDRVRGENGDDIRARHPGFQLPYQDVTKNIFNNPTFVPDQEKPERGIVAVPLPNFISASMNQDRQRQNINVDRTAAKMVFAWSGMVGRKIADRFTALAAISLVTNPHVPTFKEHELVQYLRNQPQIMAGETPAERAKLTKELIKLAKIILDADLMPQKPNILKAVFAMLATNSPVIGKERQQLNQIQGYIYGQAAEAKLAATFPDLVKREQARSELGQLMGNAFLQALPQERSKVLNIIYDALNHGSFSLEHVKEIIKAPEPAAQFEESLKDVNKDRLQESYKHIYHKEELDTTEIKLIHNLGRQRNLDPNQLPKLGRAINAANTAYTKAEALRTELTTQRQDLQTKGVEPETMDQAIEALEQAGTQLLESASLQQASARAELLETIVADQKSRITWQQTLKTTRDLVQEKYAEKLEDSGLFSTDNIVARLVADRSSDKEIKRRLETLITLDEDLQIAVLAGGELKLAADEQKKRHADKARREAEAKAAKEEKPAEPQAGEEAKKPIGGVIILGEPAKEPTKEEVKPIEATTPVDTRAQREREKIERYNGNLSEGVIALREVLRTSVVLAKKDLSPTTGEVTRQLINDLGAIVYEYPDINSIMTAVLTPAKDLTPEIIEKARQILNRLGTTLYSHPDTDRVMSQDYPLLSRDVQALHARIAQIEQETLTGGSRTR